MNDDFQKKLNAARKRVQKMDAIDGAKQIDFGVLQCIVSCKAAIESGVSTGDDGPVMDAYVMLEQAFEALR